jgi:hypothetical protein
MRRSVYKRYLEGPFGKLKLDEIKPAQLMKHCESIREKGASAPAVQVREIVLLVYRCTAAKDKSFSAPNPAEAIRPSDIATFKARDRALSPREIRKFLDFRYNSHCRNTPPSIALCHVNNGSQGEFINSHGMRLILIMRHGQFPRAHEDWKSRM